MKLGLVRHFKVVTSSSSNVFSSSEFDKRMLEYDKSPIKISENKISEGEWDICYSSTLPRAEETAKYLYAGEINYTDLLREVPLSSFTKKQIKLPSFIWHVGGRIAWALSSKSQSETIKQTKERIKLFLELIQTIEHKNILIVTHGFFMKALVAELKKIGFTGKFDISPKNGELYIFSK